MVNNMSSNNQLLKDCGCTEDVNAAGFQCSPVCGKFDTCNARFVYAEVTRPFPKDGPQKPVKKSSRKITNAQYAAEYGISKRQVAKAIREASATAKPVRTILKRISKGN
jgi:glycerol dehydrogenase-like iron-containing ADH family enzyme